MLKGMSHPSLLTVARGILLHGGLDPAERLHRRRLLETLKVADATFRNAGEKLGARTDEPGLRFFDSSIAGRLAFGPGAGLVVGVAVGTESLRAAIVDANGW